MSFCLSRRKQILIRLLILFVLLATLFTCISYSQIYYNNDDFSRNQWSRDDVATMLPTMNTLGAPWVDISMALDCLQFKTMPGFQRQQESIQARKFTESLRQGLLQQMSHVLWSSQNFNHVDRRKQKLVDGNEINVAIVACGHEGAKDAEVSIKSAIMFSQDSNLHLIIFTDAQTISPLLLMVIKFKWSMNFIGTDFTFEFHLDWFPPDGEVDWRHMWRPCSTQRLFFPQLLPHIDSLIYLDADTLVLSNMSTFWDIFQRMQNTEKVAGMTRNGELLARNHYNTKSRIPYYGTTGVMGGVIMMNLTRMRLFNMQQIAIETYKIYQQNILLADQDIYNIIFHFNPEKLYLLDCTYNFYNVHCGDWATGKCFLHDDNAPACFCYEAMETGVKILHGNMGSFYEHYPFIMETRDRFSKHNLLKDSALDLIQDLKNYFNSLNEPHPCFHLTAKALYSNAETYLKNLHS